VETEGLVTLVEDRHAQDVRRQEVGRELDALERGADRTRERLGERRLAGAGIVLEQHVAAARERREQPSDRRRLPPHDRLDGAGEPPECVAARRDSRHSRAA